MKKIEQLIKVGHAQVVILRLMVGLVFGGSSDSDLFTLGGANNLCGYEDNEFCGTRFYEGTSEYRYSIVKKL